MRQAAPSIYMVFLRSVPRAPRAAHPGGRLLIAVLILTLQFTVACATRPDATANPAPASDSPAGDPESVRPVALLDGQGIYWTELRDLLAETAGAAILEEVILDRKLEDRIDRRGLEITEGDLQVERRLLLETLDPGDADRAELLLDELRRRRALGERRFTMLLHRNAMLRAMVRSDVEIADEEIETEFQRVYGPRYQLRLFTAATPADASDARRRITSGGSFGDVAVQFSTDASAARGGLLEPVSPWDPQYPESIRRILSDLEVGELSPILPIENGFAFIELVRTIPPAEGVELNEVRSQIERSVRLARERFLMESLARELLAESEVLILDPPTRASWQRQRGGGGSDL